MKSNNRNMSIDVCDRILISPLFYWKIGVDDARDMC